MSAKTFPPTRYAITDLETKPTLGKNVGLSFMFRMDPTLKRADAINLLALSKPALADRYGVTQLALFGSTARDSAGATSDVDVLVAFNGPASSARYFGVQFYLEDLFGCAVDLITEKSLREELRPYVEKEAIRV